MRMNKGQNPWITHAKAYMKSHKCTFSDALKLSAKTAAACRFA